VAFGGPEIQSTVRVCVVEDNTNLRDLLVDLFVSADVEVLAAVSTVKEGEKTITDYVPDVAVIDYQLPDGTGLDLIRRLVVAVPQVTLLLYTAAALSEDATRSALEAGATAVIPKSLHTEQLLDAVLSGRLSRTETVRVCVVEDNTNLRDLLIDLFVAADVEVVAAVGTVKEGERTITDYLPDVAVIDYRLPDGTGLDLIRTLAVTVPQVTLLLYAAALTDDGARRALEAGATAVVAKSLNTDQLLEAVWRGRIRPKA
jgi:DNA-binding NarL/FixJ family response regulator